MAVWHLVRQTQVLDLNSAYSYFLVCHFFKDTCVVAEGTDGIVGLASAVRAPSSPDTLFVWQVAVAPSARRRGLAFAMVTDLVARCGTGLRYLEATIAPDNAASWALFERVARSHHAALRRQEVLPGRLFGSGHPPEVLVRIGPLGDA